MNSSKLFEYDSRHCKTLYLIGCDEAGRGPGAGDLFCAAVCFLNTDKEFTAQFAGLNDSKQLTETKRQEIFELIKNTPSNDLLYCITPIAISEIERYNILSASLFGMKLACENIVSKLNSDNLTVFVDGDKPLFDWDYEQKAIPKGDATSAAIAAASVLAKVARDEYMRELDKEFPIYNWAHNKGYLTKDHLEAIDRYGLTKYHRTSFLKTHFAQVQQLSLNF